MDSPRCSALCPFCRYCCDDRLTPSSAHCLEDSAGPSSSAIRPRSDHLHAIALLQRFQGQSRLELRREPPSLSRHLSALCSALKARLLEVSKAGDYYCWMTRPSKTLRGLRAVSRKTSRAGFAGLAVCWFLGLSGLYVLYASGTFFALGDDLPVNVRLGMVLGPTSVALSLLVAVATFAAAVRSSILIGEHEPGTRGRHAAQLVVLSSGAYVLSAFGPTVSLLLLSLTQYWPLDVVPASQQFLDSARIWVPGTIAVFAFLSGVAGGLIGRVTLWRKPGGRAAMTWFSCLVLILSFWLPFLLTSRMILFRGVPTPWILPGSLVVPTLLVGLIAWRVFDPRRACRVRRARAQSSSFGPEDVDRVDRMLNPVGEPGESGINVTDATRAELELIHMAKGLRRVVGLDASVSQKRVDEIVKGLLSTPPIKTGRSSFAWRAVGARLTRAGEFCTSWTCLATGLLLVGVLGGVPPNLVLAASAGLVGSVIYMAMADQSPRLAR